jgi:hypothetical protein
MLNRIFISMKGDARGGRRNLYNEEFHNLYSSPDIIMSINQNSQIDGACATHEGDEKCFQIFSLEISRKEGKLGDLGISGWEENMDMGLRGCELQSTGPG